MVWLPVIAVAAVKAAAGLVGAGLGLVAGAGETPLPPWVFALQISVFGVVASYLLIGSRGDARAHHLGVAFLLIASTYAYRPLELLAVSQPGIAAALRGLTVDSLLPAAAWLFFRDFPRAIPSPRRTFVARLGIGVSLVVGLALLATNAALPWLSDPGTGLIAALDADRPTSQYWTLVYGLTVPALALAYWNARTATDEERRRVRLFLAGMTAAALPVCGFILAFAVVPGFAAWARSPAIDPIVMPIVQLFIVSIPVSTAYAVLVDRVVDVRTLLRRALEYGLARAIVTTSALAPFAIFAAVLYRLRAETLSSMLEAQRVLVLGGALGVGLVAIRLRRASMDTIDRTFFRERYDARRILTGLTAQGVAAGSADELARLFSAEIDRALHLAVCDVLTLAPLREEYRSASGLLRPLARETRLAALLGQAGDPISVDLTRPDSRLRSLPDAEKEWLADADVHELVPLVGSGQSLLGVIALGAKRSELPFSREDRELLSAIAATGALALEQRILRDTPRATQSSPLGAEDSDAAAMECAACGRVHATAEVMCPACGGELAPAAVPPVLLGKFELEERIGAGSAGVVYRALDLALGRTVAIKALPRTTPEDSVRLRREARAMATVAHPNLATLYAAETWKGTPLLVVEYLEGGTLEAKMERGPMPSAEVIDLGLDLAGALERLHGSGILHRDVKPTNIGFAADGTPKLLDFGLAHSARRDESAPARVRADDAAGFADASVTEGVMGTPLYMSPEALAGERADVSFDIWALEVVLFEALTGRHPFECETWMDTLSAIRTGHVVQPATAGASPARESDDVRAVLERGLAASRQRRPARARDLRDQLEELRAGAVV